MKWVFAALTTSYIYLFFLFKRYLRHTKTRSVITMTLLSVRPTKYDRKSEKNTISQVHFKRMIVAQWGGQQLPIQKIILMAPTDEKVSVLLCAMFFFPAFSNIREFFVFHSSGKSYNSVKFSHETRVRRAIYSFWWELSLSLDSAHGHNVCTRN